MQASILPKRADHEAQKLGFLPPTSVAAFFEQHSAGCGVAGRHSAARAAAGRLGDDRAVAGRCPTEHTFPGDILPPAALSGSFRTFLGPKTSIYRPTTNRVSKYRPKSPGASGFRPAAPERPARLRTATPGRPTRHRPTLRPTFRAAHLRRHPTSSAKIAKYNPRICVM